MPLRAFALYRLGAERGFTLVEMIIVVFLLALAMLGLLAVFDASARINKSETEVADAQGAVRFGIYQMTRAIRMAGTGGLYVTQAVLNHADPDLPGLTVVNSKDPNSYDNIETGTTVTDTTGGERNVRPGTDMIEIRGVVDSPMLGFDESPGNGCGVCQGTVPINIKTTTATLHVNNDSTQRPQFAAIDSFTAGATVSAPMFVIVAENGDIHQPYTSLTAQNPFPTQHYPQPRYNVGFIKAHTTLAAASPTFGNVFFASDGDVKPIEFNNEFPKDPGTDAVALERPGAPGTASWLRHAGVLEDLVYFIDNTDLDHPALAQGTRRGAAFDIVTLADDVEDMQIAYGVDSDRFASLPCPGGTPHPCPDEGIGRLIAPPYPSSDPDANVSNQPGQDEWVPNVPGNDNPITLDDMPFKANDFVANSGALDPTIHYPRLHSVMVSLVARSKNPDPTYRAPLGSGLLVMNAPAPAPASVALHHRRRVQTLKINLRNYSFD